MNKLPFLQLINLFAFVAIVTITSVTTVLRINKSLSHEVAFNAARVQGMPRTQSTHKVLQEDAADAPGSTAPANQP